MTRHASHKRQSSAAHGEFSPSTGTTASSGAFARLEAASKAKTNRTLTPTGRGKLIKALNAYKVRDFGAAALLAVEVTRTDPHCSQAFHALALALEGLGELHKALEMYERALKLDPEDAELYVNLGMVAQRLQMNEAAEKFFRLFIQLRPDNHLGYNNLGGVLRDMGRKEEAIEVLRGAIYKIPNNAELWNTLGTVAMEDGLVAEARSFYEEALRLAPRMARIYHNLGYATNHTGPLDEALTYYDKALRLMDDGNRDRPEARNSRALCLLGMGRLKEGWDEWEARLDVRFRASVLYAIQAPRWQGESLAGKRLLIIGEQGLGDEIMFASCYQELADQCGPDGQVIVATDRRLAPLLRRTFPTIRVETYASTTHNGKQVRLCPWLKNEPAPDFYTQNGSTLRFLRDDISRFPTDRPIFVPDPERVAFWQQRLKDLGPGPYVGICWRSMVTSGTRGKYFSPLDHWAPVMSQRNVRFINLQYGDCKAELDYFKTRHGAQIHVFDDLDLKNNLDDNAALCAALDLVVSAPTAAGALAGAVGTRTWLLTIGYVWPQLGTDRFPWFPNNRVLSPPTYADWPALMALLAHELSTYSATYNAAEDPRKKGTVT